MATRTGGDFAREADLKQASFLAELWQFLATNKKWWLAPIIIVLLAFGLLVALGGTAAAPFIYTLF
jgi:hypothetical protein